MTTNHATFYSKAKFYDIAFNFKNVKEENQTILDVYKKWNKCDAKSFLDIAAGPATNAVEMAERGLKTSALDFSPEMVSYGLEKARCANVQLNYKHGDMRKFQLTESVELAAIFMDSMSYLVTNEDVIMHLKSVADCMADNGIYVLEMSHPRDVFSVGSSASTEWTTKENNIEVSVKWGSSADAFDPITQLTEVTAKLTYKVGLETGEIIDHAKQRCFTFNELKALVAASGAFELIDVLGSLKPDVKFSNEKSSWRMIPILRKL